MKTFKIASSTPVKPNDRYWQFCVGSCHAALALRADYQKQLKQVHDDLGFQRVRFHGLFDDDMHIITTLKSFMGYIPGSAKVKTQSFYHVALVYDTLLDMGIKPFVELGFMPSAIARGKRTVFAYKGNVTPPREYRQWENLIRDFIRFLIARYGKKEVESWYFEVWNEPDLRGFFWTGSKEEYFQLYKSTVMAIKSIDPNIRVGGPATSQNRWLTDMKRFCAQEKLPLDFLSTHHYPGDDVGIPILTWQNIKRMLMTAKKNPGLNVTQTYHKMMYRPEILPLIKKDSMYNQALQARKEAGETPLFYTEWNVNPTCTAPAHDTTQSSCYIIKHMMESQYIMDGASFWCFSDIFEESTFFPQPFTGSFGLMNIYGIPKPSYWAFYLLNRLGDERLDLPTTHEEIEMAAFRSHDAMQLLVYRQQYTPDKHGKETVALAIEDSRRVKAVSRLRIDAESGNPIDIWKGMGAPETLSRQQVDQIKKASRPVKETLPFTQEKNTVRIETALDTNDVHLIEVKFEEDQR